MVDKALFTSKSDNWATPQAFFDALDAEFHFTLDVCADASNAKCERYFTVVDDGLAQEWAPHTVWMNPPYSNVKAWMRKAAEEASKGATVVCLVPSRTDTRWFHEYVYDVAKRQCRPGVKVRFVKGRLKFGSGANSAPFPSMVVIFNGRDGD